MALTLKSFARNVRRAAKAALVQGATVALKSTPLGNAAFRAGVALRQLGGKVSGARALKRQGQSVNAAITALSNAKRPGIIQTQGGPQWIEAAAGPDLKAGSESSARPKRRKRTSKAGKTASKTGRPKSRKYPPDTSYPPDTEAEERALMKRKGSSSTRRNKSKTEGPTIVPPHLRARADWMKRMGVKWRAAGKPGKWLDFLKANPFKG